MGVADLGGSIITGIDGNPLAVLANQMKIPLHDINTEGVALYMEDGMEANKEDDDLVSLGFPSRYIGRVDGSF